jgi:hypothetical protein
MDPGVPSPAAGFVTALSTDSRLRRYGLPASTGSPTAFFGGDFYWTNPAGNIKSLRGGYRFDGGRAGLWYLGLGHSRSDTDAGIGFRPIFRSWNLIL